MIQTLWSNTEPTARCYITLHVSALFSVAGRDVDAQDCADVDCPCIFNTLRLTKISKRIECL